MTESDPKDELRSRFDSSKKGPNTKQHGDADAEQTAQNEQTDDAPQGSDDPANVKDEWSHIAIYVPPELADEYHSFADVLDGRSKIADRGKLDKNREFNRTVIEYILNNKEEIAAELELSKDQIEL